MTKKNKIHANIFCNCEYCHQLHLFRGLTDLFTYHFIRESTLVLLILTYNAVFRVSYIFVNDAIKVDN